MRPKLLLPALVAALVLGVLVPAGAVAVADGVDAQTTNDSAVNVTAGAQLSTVLSVTSDDVRAEVKETAFEVEYEREDGRAEAVADRAEQLRERAGEAAEAYREGESRNRSSPSASPR